jgi:hypothetical protein
MGKTRKIKNKKLFLKWLKRSQSHINKYSIKSGGLFEYKKTNKEIQESQVVSNSGYSPLKNESKIKNKAIALAGIVTLGDMAYALASNPVVVAAFVGLGVTSQAFLGIATGGGLLVLSGVLLYATMKIKLAYKNYYTMVHVMNDLIILLQKIDNMVRVAIKISQQYQFVIDTKDVNKSLERIFSRFDKLLSVEDIGKIKKDIEDNTSNIQSTMYSAFEDATEEQEQQSLLEDVDKEEPKELTLLQKITRTIRVLKFDSKKFTSKLNEEVMRLGLYFSILLGEFNIILNVCQMNTIGKRDLTKLSIQNGSVKNSEDFKKLLVSSLIYRTLQIYNIFTLCKPGTSISTEAKKTTCSDDSMEQYIIELEAERVKIRKVLFGKSINSKESLFPLYIDEDFGKGERDRSLLNELRQIMRQYGATIDTKDDATKFVNQIHKFNEQYSAATRKTISNSATGSTASTDHLLNKRDYIEDVAA